MYALEGIAGVSRSGEWSRPGRRRWLSIAPEFKIAIYDDIFWTDLPRRSSFQECFAAGIVAPTVFRNSYL